MDMTDPKFTICHKVTQWWETHYELRGKPLTLVLHTSCVNFSSRCFQYFQKMGFKLLLPNSVFWELKLLQRSKNYSLQADALLECAPVASWDLEELYMDAEGHARHSLTNIDGSLLFLFGDMNKQDEFLTHVADIANSYILVNPRWAHDDARQHVCRLRDMRQCAYRDVIPLTPGQDVENIRSQSEIHCCSLDDVRISGLDFCPTNQCGAYSQIYTHPQFPKHLFKIYRKTEPYVFYAQCGTYARKLRFMQDNCPQSPLEIPREYFALPEHLLMNDRQQILGYSMPAFRGKPIRELIATGWAGKTQKDMNQILENLLLRMLELHTSHVLINDLSSNNILVDDDNQVYLVDCDSFQYYEYTGGAITRMYQHRELSSVDSRIHLREPRHEYFSLAVLLFQCLILDEPIPAHYYSNTYPNWSKMSFPLEVDGGRFEDVNAAVVYNWTLLTREMRRLFCDEFHFRSDNSIGAWLRVLELL